MQANQTPSKTTSPDRPDPQDVRRELALVLDSAAFRTSKRCHDFLDYAVSRALDGDLESLRERSLAVEVFGRKSNAALGDDSIVRVGAREVRKRLAQYYVADGANDVVRIDLPAGSYVPAFHWRRDARQHQPVELTTDTPLIPANPLQMNKIPEQPRAGRVWWLWLALALLVAAGSGFFLWKSRTSSAVDDFEAFWQPVFSQPGPVLIGLAHPVVYHPSARLVNLDEELNGGAQAAQRPVHVAAQPQPNDYVPVFDQYVGFGDAVAAARLAVLFTQHGRTSKLRLAGKVEFADLRDSSAVLLGAFSNRWTAEFAREGRYRFEMHAGKPWILDTNTRRKWTLTGKTADGQANEDFILLCRLVHAPTGGFVAMGAGLTQYGTQEAGQILSNPDALIPILKKLPAAWRTHNLEVVLHSQIVGEAPAVPEVLAWYVW